MPKGPRRRKRALPKPAARAIVVAPVATPQGPREWCESHMCEIPAGDPAHDACPRIALQNTRHQTNANWSVYFDEAIGAPRKRMRTFMEGFDRVLGGGFVLDAIYLLSGKNGAGKSTFLLQICAWWLMQFYRVLYVSAEENASQVGERAERLGVPWQGRVLRTTDMADVRAELRRLEGTEDDPDLVIVDSAQTIGDSETTVGAIGSVAMSMHIARCLADIAKDEGRCVVLVGQVNKEGSTAGSEQLPHLVDVRLELDKNELGERSLTDPKNRFGIADEVLVLDMTEKGLVEIGNVTEEHLARRLGDVGIVPFAAADRARPVLVAVTASARVIEEDTTTKWSECEGYEPKRLRNVLDSLQADCGCVLQGRAIRVHVPQILGEDIKDKEIDLAVAAALLSALHNRPVPKALYFGKVGIDGYVEGDKRAGMRLNAGRDHKTLRFTDAIIPAWTNATDGVKVKRVKHMRELMPAMWGTALAMPRPTKPETVGQTMA